jgi:hypothetical protein
LVKELHKPKFKNYYVLRSTDKLDQMLGDSSGVSVFPYKTLISTNNNDLGKVVMVEARKEEAMQAVLKRIKAHGAFSRCFCILRDPAHAILQLDHNVTDVDISTILSIQGVNKLKKVKGAACHQKAMPVRPDVRS